MCQFIIGLDEVGIGSIAGIVTTAAVILTKDAYIPGVRDSKEIHSYMTRKRLSEIIKERSLFWVIASSPVGFIDSYGMESCRFSCFKMCAKVCIKFCSRFGIEDYLIYVDGDKKIPNVPRQIALPKADKLIHSVSAASIIAKAFRDKYMLNLSRQFPQYGWDTNFGYPTKQHIKALEEHGLTNHHRRSYSIIKKML
jgi:ribonuclease HII